MTKEEAARSAQQSLSQNGYTTSAFAFVARYMLRMLLYNIAPASLCFIWTRSARRSRMGLHNCHLRITPRQLPNG